MGVGMAIGQTMAASLSEVGESQSEDPMKMIAKLHELLKAGALTQTEFDTKKAELLAKLK
jgi:hypothetical protein